MDPDQHIYVCALVELLDSTIVDQLMRLPLHLRQRNWRHFCIYASLLSVAFITTPSPALSEGQDNIVYDRVIRKLVNDYKLKTNALKVIVTEGAVSITGLVETEKLRVRVGKIVSKIKGVKKVDNQVRVRR